MSRSWRLCVATVLFAACSSEGSSVRVTHNSRDISPCRYLGEVRTHEGLKDLKRKADALGANAVLVVGESVSIQGASGEISGIAYRCP
jgi:hypothetical protein